jgi:DNA replication protein DnaC
MMGVNGYSDKLIAIDDEMSALGRPPPPVVSWISGGLKGDITARSVAWRAQVEQWEEAHPQDAIRWAELRAQYIAQDELEEKLKHGDDAWSYVLLERLGVPRENLDVIRRKFDDKQSMRAANDWMRDGVAWGLVLIGGNGCGKSSAAAWAAHQLLMRNFRPAWVDCPRQSEASMYGVEAEHRRWTCRNAAALVLDDLGGGKRERETKPGEPNHLWLAWLDDVLGARANDRKKTIITTNRSVDELAPWLGARLTDRLRAAVVHSSNEKSMRGAR